MQVGQAGVTLRAKVVSKTGRTDLWDWPKSSTTYRTAVGTQGGYRWAAGTNARVTVRTASSASSAGAKILAEAKRHNGALYKFAAAGPSRFDCSGYTMYVYRRQSASRCPTRRICSRGMARRSAKAARDLVI